MFFQGDVKVCENDLNDYFRSLANKEDKLDISTFKHVIKQVGLNPDEGIVNQTVEELQSKWTNALSNCYLSNLINTLSLFDLLVIDFFLHYLNTNYSLLLYYS